MAQVQQRGFLMAGESGIFTPEHVAFVQVWSQLASLHRQHRYLHACIGALERAQLLGRASCAWSDDEPNGNAERSKQ